MMELWVHDDDDDDRLRWGITFKEEGWCTRGEALRMMGIWIWKNDYDEWIWEMMFEEGWCCARWVKVFEDKKWRWLLLPFAIDDGDCCCLVWLMIRRQQVWWWSVDLKMIDSCIKLNCCCLVWLMTEWLWWRW